SCCNRPNTAEVLAGANVAVPINSVQLTDRGTTLRYRWNPITIQPGQTMNFLHYSVQHDPADNAGLQDEAQRLVNLTDPDALAGLTAQEQAAVVNFNIAGTPVTSSTAQVVVTVLRADNTPLAGAEVIAQDSGGTPFVGTTAADGTVTLPSVPTGTFFAIARKNGFAGSVSTVITAAQAGTTVSLTITAPVTGNISGTVFAADGQTPIAGATVTVLDAASNSGLLVTTSDAAGHYAFTRVTAALAGFLVKAQSQQNLGLRASQAGALTANGDQAIVNLTLPLSLVQGTVTFSDGSPVPFPNIVLTSGNQSLTPVFTDANGNYEVLGAPAGSFSL